jgi:hypothetical protein
MTPSGEFNDAADGGWLVLYSHNSASASEVGSLLFHIEGASVTQVTLGGALDIV